jgi:hypothetical protein
MYARCTSCGCAAIELRGGQHRQQCDRCYPQIRPVGSVTGCGCGANQHARATATSMRGRDVTLLIEKRGVR